MAKINEFKKVQKEDTKLNNYCIVFMAGVLSVFFMTGFNGSVAVECCKCFGLALGVMVIDMGIQYLKGNFDQINKTEKTERKEVNKKEA